MHATSTWPWKSMNKTFHPSFILLKPGLQQSQKKWFIDCSFYTDKLICCCCRMPRESQTTREPQRQQDAIPDPGAFLQIVRVISLAEALPKDSLLQTTPFQAPLSLLSTPTSFPTPMASPFSLMSPLPVPSPTVLHEPEPTSAESVTKQEREKGTEANGKGKEKKWSSPPGTPPVPGGVKRKSGETADGETAEGKAVEGKRPRVTDSQHLAEHLMPYHSLVTSAVRNCRYLRALSAPFIDGSVPHCSHSEPFES